VKPSLPITSERADHGGVTLKRIDLAEEWEGSLLNVKKERHVMRTRNFYCASERTSKALIWSPTATLPVHDGPPRPRARRIQVGIGVVD
jgi:hypothetical protein